MNEPVGEQVSGRVARSDAAAAAGIHPVGEEEDECHRGESPQRDEGSPAKFGMSDNTDDGFLFGAHLFCASRLHHMQLCYRRSLSFKVL